MNNQTVTQINSDYGYKEEDTTLNVPDAPHVGLVLMERRVDENTMVKMVYWGAHSDPKLTIVVECEESFYLVARDEYVVDTYLHANASSDMQRIPITEIKGTYK